MPYFPLGPPTQELVARGYWTVLNFELIYWEHECPEHVTAWMCQFIMLELLYTYVWKAHQNKEKN